MVRPLTLVLSIFLSFDWSSCMLNCDNPKYSNLWGANIQGGEEVAQAARDLGLTYKGQFLRPVIHSETSNSPTQLDEDPQYTDVINVLKSKFQKQQQTSFKESNQIFPCTSYPRNIQSYLTSVGQKKICKLGTFSTRPFPKSKVSSVNLVNDKSVELLQSKKISAYVFLFNDPFWRKQWYMQDYRTTDMPVRDLNVIPVYKIMYTGKEVTVAVVDNGVEHDNPDLVDNFLPDLSYDMCEDKPGSWPDEGESHGTSCAGIIAMAADNEKCGVGIAYNAKIVGIKAICKTKQTESVTAKALVHRLEIIDIYSNSWGVNTEGRYLYEQVQLGREAYLLGIMKGRRGRGAIYVQTAGNEKQLGENCAVSPDVNNPYVITIAGADQYGRTTPYSERCTAVFATAYTSSKETEGIVAPVLKGGCTTNFGGTSAACPQAAGIIALVLEANPALTYRDVMHIITMSAEVAPLASNQESWYKNGRGFWVSNDFGFGLLNAENMVLLAKKWNYVSTQHECKLTLKLDEPEQLSLDKTVTVSFKTTACEGSYTEINYIELVEVTSNVDFPRRGQINIILKSPSGTTSQLLETRSNDQSPDGLKGWSIVSTHNWGESAKGLWNVIYKVDPVGSPASTFGHVFEVTLTLYGTQYMPSHYEKTREYAAFRFPDGKWYDA